MAVRFIAGPILLAIVFAAMWGDAHFGVAWCFGGLTLIGAACASYEVCVMARRVGLQAWTGLAVAGAVALVLTGVLYVSHPDFAYDWVPPLPAVWVGFVLLVLLAWLVRGRGPEDIGDVSLTVFAAAYVGGLAWFLVATEGLAWPEIRPDPATAAAAARSDGVLALFWMLCSAKSADIFAFCGGKAYGRHKLAPSISPGKTIEGALTGLAGSVLVGCLLKPVAGGAGQLMSWPQTVAFAASCSIACQLGDLVESRLKRRAGVKDSGALLPEYGGFLDMVDGLIFAAPVGYAWFRAGIG